MKRAVVLIFSDKRFAASYIVRIKAARVDNCYPVLSGILEVFVRYFHCQVMETLTIIHVHGETKIMRTITKSKVIPFNEYFYNYKSRLKSPSTHF